jgi:hypothetical protein
MNATLATPVTSVWEVRRQVSALLATFVLRKLIHTCPILTTKLILVPWGTIVSLDRVLLRDALSRPTHSRQELNS